MPWKIQSVVGERWRLIRTLLEKQKSVLQLSRYFGVSRKTVYKWKARFLQGGRRALRNRSRRPQRMPRHLAERRGRAGVYPSPRPSPLGRGRMVRRLGRIDDGSRSNPPRLSGRASCHPILGRFLRWIGRTIVQTMGRCAGRSLSPRERVRVRVK